MSPSHRREKINDTCAANIAKQLLDELSCAEREACLEGPNASRHVLKRKLKNQYEWWRDEEAFLISSELFKMLHGMLNPYEGAQS